MLNVLGKFGRTRVSKLRKASMHFHVGRARRTRQIPVLGFAAYSGTGKTTLLEKLLPLMKLQGLNIALIKHSHHDFDIDHPGKDSYRLRKAGADQMMVVSDKRSALMTEFIEPKKHSLQELVESFELEDIDLVLVEGFRHLEYPKIELRRREMDREALYKKDRNIIAVAADHLLDVGDLPLLDINQPEEIAGFINRWIAI